MRNYLDPVIKTDQCAQYYDDIAIAGVSLVQPIDNLRAVFKCIQNAGLKISFKNTALVEKILISSDEPLHQQASPYKNENSQNFPEKSKPFALKR